MRQWLSQQSMKRQSFEAIGSRRSIAISLCLALALVSWQASGQIAYRVSTQSVEPVYSTSRVLPPGPPTRTLSSAGLQFNIWFEDVINSTGFGFDDPSEGLVRQFTLDQVLGTVANTIKMPGELDVLVEVSEIYVTSGTLAYAGTLFPNQEGFIDGTSLIRLRENIKPFEGFEEIFTAVNFGWDWHTVGSGPIGPNQFSLSTVLLHEITHGLGFLSLSDSSGQSFFAPAVAFSTFDSFFEASDETRVWAGVPPALPSLQVPSSVLTSNSLFFGGPEAFSHYTLGIRPGIFAPSPYQPGSSLSHWDTGNIVGGAVMEHAVSSGVIFDRYSLVDIGALRDIGYINASPPLFTDKIFLFRPGEELRDSGSERTGPVSDIDLTISFYRPSLTPAQNIAYVRILEHFADAVFEATDGAHRIRNVIGTSYGQFSSVADIIWGLRGQPNTKKVGGRGIPGGHINMYDIFEMGAGTSDLNFLENDANMRKAGYVLAQQWMRYYLGIENEFAEISSDIPVVPSLMNDPYTSAITGEPRRLNLSVAGDEVAPFTNFEHTFATAQHRLNAMSAWSTISRNYTNNEPKSGHEVGRRLRSTFPELGPVAPTGTDRPRIDLSALAGSPINVAMPGGPSGPILFPNEVTDPPEDVIFDPVFVTYGDTLVNSRSSTSSDSVQAAGTGPSNRFVLGVDPQTFSFVVDDAATQLYVSVYFDAFAPGVNVTLLNSLGIPQPVVSSTITSVFDVFGLLGPPMEVVSFVATPPARGVWSLTVSSRAGLIGTFFDVEMVTEEHPILLSGSATVGREGMMFVPQSTLAIPATFLSYPEPFVVVANLSRGLPIRGANLTATLTRPNGFDSDLVFTDNGVAPDLVANDGSYTAQVDYLQNGTHRIRVAADNKFNSAFLTYNGTSRSPGELPVSPSSTDIVGLWDVFATGTVTLNGESFSDSDTFRLRFRSDNVVELDDLSCTDDEILEFPYTRNGNSVSVNGSFSTGSNCDGDLSEMGTVGLRLTLDSNIAFSGSITLNSSGVDAFLNPFTFAFTGTVAGTLLSIDGTSASVALPQLPDVHLNEDFMRLLDIVVVVQGLQPDDHKDFFQSATAVAADNADVFGRIDFPGDLDYFSFVAPMGSGNPVPLNVRATRLGGGISAQLTVYDIDGRTILESGRPSPMGYMFADVALIPGFTYYASVKDNDSTRITGTYAFSAGPAIATDTGVFGVQSRAPGGGGGGGGSCLIATAAYGTPLASEIGVLREIRDRYLLQSSAGIAFVDAYYRVSPPIADAVASHPALGSAIRIVLVPVLMLSKLVATAPLWILALFIATLFALIAMRKRRSAVRIRQT